MPETEKFFRFVNQVMLLFAYTGLGLLTVMLLASALRLTYGVIRAVGRWLVTPMASYGTKKPPGDGG